MLCGLVYGPRKKRRIRSLSHWHVIPLIQITSWSNEKESQMQMNPLNPLFAVIFVWGAMFYTYRLFRPSLVTQKIGWNDPPQEVAHGLALWCMADILGTHLLTALQWGIFLWPVGLYFVLRAPSYKKRPFSAWWWDPAHAGMLILMPLMDVPMQPVLHWLYFAFWCWFALLYGWYITLDIKNAATGQTVNKWKCASNCFHLFKYVIMSVMVLWPALFMSMNMSATMKMSGPMCGPPPAIASKPR